MPRKKSLRMTISTPPSMRDDLDHLRLETGYTSSRLITDSVALTRHCVDELRQGSEIYVKRSDGTLEKIFFTGYERPVNSP